MPKEAIYCLSSSDSFLKCAYFSRITILSRSMRLMIARSLPRQREAGRGGAAIPGYEVLSILSSSCLFNMKTLTVLVEEKMRTGRGDEIREEEVKGW